MGRGEGGGRSGGLPGGLPGGALLGLLTGAYDPGGISLHFLFGLFAVSVSRTTEVSACGTAASATLVVVPALWPVRFFRCCSLPRSRLLALCSTAHMAARTCAQCTSRRTFSARTASHAPAAVAFLFPPATRPPRAPVPAPCSSPRPLPILCSGCCALDAFNLTSILSCALRSLSLPSTVAPSCRCAPAPMPCSLSCGRKKPPP